MKRTGTVTRQTAETEIALTLNLEGSGCANIVTGIPFFDHMLTLFCVHGFFDLSIDAKGDIDVDYHHTVEDIGLVLGEALNKALGDRKGIKRYGHAVTPMDETLSEVSIDLSNRPFLVYNLPKKITSSGKFDAYLAKEFFRSFAVKGGMNLHINVKYGENEHHIIESIFKAMGRSLAQAVSFNPHMKGVLSSKGAL
ncbi:MAG: imidazoleglycerol-phosphate dehydratase [Desulfobacteraceae bacterium 4572_19]|nr:MAG: imidazoleglycerol-phosphate dehydratase [Desulfobacteraceae bacterium 4572_19]